MLLALVEDIHSVAIIISSLQTVAVKASWCFNSI